MNKATERSQGPALSPAAYKPEGIHLMLELGGCSEELLRDRAALELALTGSARRAGVEVVESHLHRFEPHGLSGVIIIAQSHIAIHTWPEVGYASIDIYTCGDAEAAEKIRCELLEVFKPDREETRRTARRPPN
ncbi:MAG: adenosylmethionine decarboxylase [Verrucomicrobiota bacterium]